MDADAQDLSDEIEDMLLNAQARVGGAVGIGSTEAMVSLKITGHVGPGGGLTTKGAARARRLQTQRWDD